MNNFATTDSVAGVGRNVNKHNILNNIFHLCWYVGYFLIRSIVKGCR